MKNRVIYYSDELNDDFAGAKLEVDKLDGYKYEHNIVWRAVGGFLYRFVAVPLCGIYSFIVHHERIKNRKILKKYKKEGFFVYANHVMTADDAFTPSYVSLPKKPHIIASSGSAKYKFLVMLIDMFGGVPISTSFEGMKAFTNHIYRLAESKKVIYIYPEAHIWPFYTGIRPFKDVSFDYPIRADKPVFAATKTFQKRLIGRLPKVTVYVDGPFFQDRSLPIKERRAKLRNEVYSTMVERSKLSDYKYVEYIKREGQNSGEIEHKTAVGE